MDGKLTVVRPEHREKVACWCYREAGAYTRPLSAQLERSVWNRGCAERLCSPCEGRIRGVLGGVYGM